MIGDEELTERVRSALATRDDARSEVRPKTGKPTKKAVDKAVTLIKKATDALSELWEAVRNDVPDDKDAASPAQRELLAALSEAFGQRGGILRTAGKLVDAVQAYDAGNDHERHRAQELENSYNLLQRLTLRILLEPNSVGNESWTVGKVDMWQELDAAERTIKSQVRGSRKKDPWAAADWLLVRLLLADAPNETLRPDLRPAWKHLEAMSRIADVKDSLGRVLDDLLKAMKKANPESGKKLRKRLEGAKKRLQV